MDNNKRSVYNNEIIEWGGWLNEFLWICAGANREVLRQLCQMMDFEYYEIK